MATFPVGVDVLRVHLGASFMDGGYKTHDALVQNRLDLILSCMLPPGRRQLTASDVVEYVVRNPISVATLGPSVAAGGKEECGRNKDRSVMHIDWRVL